MIRIVETAFDPASELTGFREQVSKSGAIVSFTGLVRDDDGTESLTLSHYPGFTEAQIGEFVEQAKLRWDLEKCLIVHRVGRMVTGDSIVFVATASAHRRDAFEACDFLMDKLKSNAPFWKQETRAGQTKWVEPRAQDEEDLKRWTHARN